VVLAAQCIEFPLVTALHSVEQRIAQGAPSERIAPHIE
jgi:hypothetical protein